MAVPRTISRAVPRAVLRAVRKSVPRAVPSEFRQNIPLNIANVNKKWYQSVLKSNSFCVTSALFHEITKLLIAIWRAFLLCEQIKQIKSCFHVKVENVEKREKTNLE